MSSFSITVGKMAQEAVRQLHREEKAVVFSLFKSTILDTPVLTGRLRGNWAFGTTKEGRTSNALDKKGTVTIAAMRAGVASVQGFRKPVFLVNSLPYAWGIEFGGRSPEKAPLGMVRKNVIRIARLVNSRGARHLGASQ